jgi:hypothetical protein
MNAWTAPDVTHRVVLLGLPLSGRAEILAAVAREWKVAVSSFDPGISAVERPDCVVAAVTSPRHLPESVRDLMGWSNRLLIVIDPQAEREEATRDLLTVYSDAIARAARAAVQVTKADLVGEDAVMVPARFGLTLLRTFVSSTSDPPSMTAGVRYLLDS